MSTDTTILTDDAGWIDPATLPVFRRAPEDPDDDVPIPSTYQGPHDPGYDDVAGRAHRRAALQEGHADIEWRIRGA